MAVIRIDNFSRGISLANDRGVDGQHAVIRQTNPAWYGGVLGPNPPFDLGVWTSSSFAVGTNIVHAIVTGENQKFYVFADDGTTDFMAIVGGSNYSTAFATDVKVSSGTGFDNFAVAAHDRIYYSHGGDTRVIGPLSSGNAEADLSGNSAIGQGYFFKQNNKVYYFSNSVTLPQVASIDSAQTVVNGVFTFPARTRVYAMNEWGRFLVFLVGRDSGQYELWLWDVFSDGPNAIIPLPVSEGRNNNGGALGNRNGVLYVIAGPRASVYAYNGGQTVRKVWNLPAHLTNNDATQECYVNPNSAKTWRDHLFFGVQTLTTNGIESAYLDAFAIIGEIGIESIYSFGNVAESNTSNKINNQGVGGIGVGGDKVLIAGADASGGAIDDTGIKAYAWDASSFSAAKIETLIFTAPTELSPDAKFLIKRVGLEFAPLAASDSLQLDYQQDRDGTWRTLLTASTTSSVEEYIDFGASANANKTTMKDMQFRVSWTNVSATTPKLKAILIEYDIVER